MRVFLRKFIASILDKIFRVREKTFLKVKSSTETQILTCRPERPEQGSLGKKRASKGELTSAGFSCGRKGLSLEKANEANAGCCGVGLSQGQNWGG